MTDNKQVPDSYKLKQCRPDNLDEAPPGDSMPNYPSPNPQFGYNFEDEKGKFKVLIMAQDGHHAPDRWNLDQNDPGTTAQPQHEHDDYKRDPPTILQDADPKDSRIGFQSQYRLPDARTVYADVAGGDELGHSSEERARAAQNPDASSEYIRAKKSKP